MLNHPVSVYLYYLDLYIIIKKKNLSVICEQIL